MIVKHSIMIFSYLSYLSIEIIGNNIALRGTIDQSTIENSRTKISFLMSRL